MKAAIFTINTRIYREKGESAANAALKRTLERVGIDVKAAGALPEDRAVVAAVMKQLADAGSVQLILTSGATGFQKKDCAPDAVMDVADRLLPGIPEALRAYNLRYSKKVILDRSAAGIRNNTVILNLSDSAKLAKESLEYILPELVQVVETLSL